MKKTIALVLFVVMLLGAALPGFALPELAKVEKSEEKIAELKDKGIVEGFEDGSLGLDKNLKRSELTKLVVYGLGFEEQAKANKEKETKFSDVETKYWANGVIFVASEDFENPINGLPIINGYPDGTFKAEDSITNAELLKILVTLKKVDLTKEAVEKAEWPADWEKWAKELKIIGEGTGVEALELDKPAVRKDAFIGLYNAVASIEVKVEPKEEVKLDAKVVKEDLEKYLESMDLAVLELEGIATEDNKEAIDEFKKLADRAKELLAIEEPSQEELEEMASMPFKMVDGKKHKGLFNKAVKKAMVTMEFASENEDKAKDPNSEKEYLTVKKGQTITIKTPVKDVKKRGDDDNKYLKFNYITEEQFDAVTDATTGATPKYKKQELPLECYDVKAVDGGYEMIVKDLPEDAKVIKPIIYVKVAEGTYFENGTMVFVAK